MSGKREEFASLLKELRWVNFFGYLTVVFIFYCLSDWKVFNNQGLGIGFRTSLREFLGWLLYGVLIVPLVGIAIWLLNKVDVRNLGFRIGSLLRGAQESAK